MRSGAYGKLLHVIVTMGASLTGASCGSRTQLDEGLFPDAGPPGAVADDDAQGGAPAAGPSGPSRAADASAVAQDASDGATPPGLLDPAGRADSGDAASVDGAVRVDACAPIPCCVKYSPTCTCLLVCIQ